MQMSNQLKLFEILESRKKHGATFGLINEAIENVVPKFPTLMGKSNSLFLQEQFPEKYWPQALHQRYQKLFNYLSLLSLLRKLVYDGVIQREKGQEESYWNTPQWQDWSKLAKDNKIMLQSDAKAKAIATKAFPAGVEVTPEEAKQKLEQFYRTLTDEEYEFVKNILHRIKHFYLDNRQEPFTNLKVHNEKARSFMAKAYIADLAKELEGAYGSSEGYDLNNPRRIEVNVRGKEREARFVTDTFVLPTLERLKAQIKNHKISIAGKIVKPKDQEEEDALRGAEFTDVHLKQDEGLNQVNKQLFNIYYNRLMRIEKNKKAKDPKYNIKKNLVRQKARAQLNKSLKDFAGDNARETLQSFFPGADLSKIKLPYPNTEIVERGDGRVAIQNLLPAKLPKKKTQVSEIVDGAVKPVDVSNTVLLQTQLHKPVELKTKFDTKELSIDTMQTNLRNPANALGDKYFDPILFTRFYKRINFLKTNTDPALNVGVENVLKKYGLNKDSTPEQIVEASKRYFYQSADSKEYYQGSKISATFSLHPTRMSAEAKFLHKGHFTKLFDDRVDIILKKGVITDFNAVTTMPTLDFIKSFIDSFLQPSASESKPIKKLFLLRARDVINSLIELKVLENLGEDKMFVNMSQTTKPDYYVNPNVLTKLIRMELVRYLRQDWFTGSRRKGEDFILGLDKDSESLSCKAGERGWAPNLCFFGADVRVIQAAAITAMSKISASQENAGLEEELTQRQSLINARAKVRFVLEEYVILFKILLKMYKTIESKNGTTAGRALTNAGHSLTEFVKANALSDTNTFINNFYTEFDKLKNDLVAGDPAAMKAIDLPPEVLSKKGGDLIKQSSMQQRFARAFNPAGLSQKMQSGELDDAELDELVNFYKKQVKASPNQKNDIKEDLLKKMNDKNKEKFLNSTNEFDESIDDTIEFMNNPKKINTRFLKHLVSDKSATDLKIIINGITKAIPYMTDANLIKILPYYLDYLFGRKPVQYSEDSRKDLIQIAKSIYNEISRRKIKPTLLLYLPPELEVLLPFLNLHT